MTVLITGASGNIGSRVLRNLSIDHACICISRQLIVNLCAGTTLVRGDFTSAEDLRRLDKHPIDAVVHLAAVVHGCSEQEGMRVNVEGTRGLLRYLVDRGCCKVVLASSIAAVGSLRANFLPVRIPIDEEHPPLVADAYGLSKALGEEVSRYFHRCAPCLDVTNLRFGAVRDTALWKPVPLTARSALDFPFIELACVALSDVVRAVRAALDRPPLPGVHVYNVVGPDASSLDAPLEILRARFGRELNTAALTTRGKDPYAPLYSMEKIYRELGFSPLVSVRAGNEVAEGGG